MENCSFFFFLLSIQGKYKNLVRKFLKFIQNWKKIIIKQEQNFSSFCVISAQLIAVRVRDRKKFSSLFFSLYIISPKSVTFVEENLRDPIYFSFLTFFVPRAYIFFNWNKMGNNHLKPHDGLALRFTADIACPPKFQAGALAGLESKLHARYCIKFRDGTYEADGQTLGSLRGTLNSGRISAAVVTSLTVVEIVSPVTISHPGPVPRAPASCKYAPFIHFN